MTDAEKIKALRAALLVLKEAAETVTDAYDRVWQLGDRMRTLEARADEAQTVLEETE